MRSTILAAVLAISTLFAAVPAMASETGGANKGANYPVAAATFQAKVQSRETKAREHMEKRIVDKKETPEQAAATRVKFDAKVAKLDAEVAKVTADGTVTKDEAKEVHQVAKELGGHHQHHHKAKDGEKRADRAATQ